MQNQLLSTWLEVKTLHGENIYNVVNTLFVFFFLLKSKKR